MVLRPRVSATPDGLKFSSGCCPPTSVRLGPSSLCRCHGSKSPLIPRKTQVPTANPVQVFTPIRTPETTGLMRRHTAPSLETKLCLYEFYLLMITPSFARG